jgi:ethylene-insensitive protein 2
MLVDTMVAGDLGASSESLTHNGPHSVTSVGDRSETAEGNVNSNGSGSLSRISGLGRAARRQFAAILDDFWSKLFDLHGQPVKQQQGGTANGRIAGSRAGARGAIQQQHQQVDHGSLPMQPGSTEGFDRDDYGMLLKPKHCLLLKKGSLGDQVSQKDTYMRPHSHAGASTSLLFSGHSNDYSGRLENLSPYTSERKYSSLHLPLYPEETHKQPATIHGYRSPSFLGRSAGTPSPAYMGTQAFRSAYTPSGQALSHQPLGVGVERESDNYKLYGRSLQGDSGLLVQDTIQSRHASQHIIDSLPGRTPLHSRVTEQLLLREGSGGQSDSGPRSWDSLLNHAALDSLVYRATGELDIPMTFDHSSPATKGVGASERAPPLSFDQISPPQSYRDGFSIQSARLENHSLWSRQPSEQLFGAALDGSSGSVRGNNSQASSQNGINNRFTTAVRPEGSITQNNNTAMGSANRVDSELEVIESLHLCLSKLLQLEGSEWLFRMDNGSDEDLVAAVATAEKSKLTAAETHDQYSSPDQWQAHSRPMTSLFNSNKLARTLHSCGDSCVWGKKGLLISFGVWSVHRLLELSLMESRPELWGKYTYVLNRLQVFHYLNPKPTLFCFTFWIFHVVDTSLNMMQLEPQHIGIIRQQFPRIGLKTSCFQPLPRTGCYRLAHM